MKLNPETKKKTMGRRKIEIKPIQNKNNLQATFCKRRSSIFKKAGELGLLTGAQIAIIVQSPSNRVYTFSNVDMDSILNRFQTGSSDPFFVPDSGMVQGCRIEYEEAERRLLMEKKRKNQVHGPVNWWDEPIEGMDLYQLEDYLKAVEGLQGKVLERVGEIENFRFVEESGLNFEVGESSSEIFEGFVDPRVCGFGDLDGSEIFDQVENIHMDSSSSDVINGPTEYLYSESNGGLEDIFGDDYSLQVENIHMDSSSSDVINGPSEYRYSESNGGLEDIFSDDYSLQF